MGNSVLMVAWQKQTKKQNKKTTLKQKQTNKKNQVKRKNSAPPNKWTVSVTLLSPVGLHLPSWNGSLLVSIHCGYHGDTPVSRNGLELGESAKKRQGSCDAGYFWSSVRKGLKTLEGRHWVLTGVIWCSKVKFLRWHCDRPNPVLAGIRTCYKRMDLMVDRGQFPKFKSHQLVFLWKISS